VDLVHCPRHHTRILSGAGRVFVIRVAGGI
jgi:hypothetical protein